jgi:diadenosine tetraphosphate (Ap4A) HIT family hydrolase
MKHSDTCFYCAKLPQLDELMIEIAKLDVSTLFLFKEQTHRGRCVVAHREHIKEIFDLPKAEYQAFMNDIARAAKAINDAMKPDKLNYGAYADKNPHLHFHIVPKYKDGPSWGSTFEMMPAEKKLLSDEEYQKLIAKIKSCL